MLRKNSVSSKIERFLENNVDMLEDISSNDLAKLLNVSQSAIIKYVKKIGYTGFSEFKISVIKKNVKHKNFDYDELFIQNNVSLSDSIEVIAKKNLYEEISSLRKTYEKLNFSIVDKFIDLIHRADVILLIGYGSSSLVATDLRWKLISAGKTVFLHSHIDVNFSHLASLKENDVVFAISHSGETKEVIQFTQKAKENKIQVLSVTSTAKSTLSKISTATIVSDSTEKNIRVTAMTSRISHLYIIDVLFLHLLRKDNKYITTIKKGLSYSHNVN